MVQQRHLDSQAKSFNSTSGLPLVSEFPDIAQNHTVDAWIALTSFKFV